MDSKTKTPMDVTLVISTLENGGAERVASLLANTWVRRGGEFRIITLLQSEGGHFYPLDSRVKLVEFGFPVLQAGKGSALSSLANNRKIISRLRRELVRLKPTVVLSFVDATNVRTLLAARGSTFPVVVSERTDPAHWVIGRVWNALRRYTYPKADAVVFQGSRVAAQFPDLKSKIRIVPNPVEVPAEMTGLQARPAESTGPFLLVTVARLVPEKRFEVLVAVFAELAPEFPDWNLEIWGDGPQRGRLQEEIEARGMQDRIALRGLTKTPHRVLADGHLFVLCSRFEGFPNALCEAMAMGLPVVATDVGAVPDIVRAGIDGDIVPVEDTVALKAGLAKYMADPRLREASGGRAREIIDRFGSEKVADLWYELFSELLGRRQVRS